MLTVFLSEPSQAVGVNHGKRSFEVQGEWSDVDTPLVQSVVLTDEDYVIARKAFGDRIPLSDAQDVILFEFDARTILANWNTIEK